MSDVTCPRCGRDTTEENLGESRWASELIINQLRQDRPEWSPGEGACVACVQEALLLLLIKLGDDAFYESVQSVWPLDAAAAFGALPTPLRMRSDPRYTGKGVTVALLDSGFYPHPDLTEPVNRIKAWVNVGGEGTENLLFGPDDRPSWPGWDAGEAHQWHGLMTSATLAGNGRLSHGLYSAMASEAELVLIQVRQPDGAISNDAIRRGLEWVREHGPELGVRVVSVSVAGDPVEPLAGNPVDMAVAALVEQGVVVLTAAGNSGQRSLVPPATAPAALTIGGIDDQNTLTPEDIALWHSNYGQSSEGGMKPELVAPSIWVVAPVLPFSEVAAEAEALFGRRAAGDDSVEGRVDELKLVTPHYQHVDGTSFATPLVAAAVACLLQANPGLDPEQVRDVLQATAETIAGVPIERQGHGVIDVSQAIALARHLRRGARLDWRRVPLVTADGILYALDDDEAGQVELLGSWNGWQSPGLVATQTEPGLWVLYQDVLPSGVYQYKFLVDGHRWLLDPANRARVPDGAGSFNSVLTVV
jgi:serine protease AprX